MAAPRQKERGGGENDGERERHEDWPTARRHNGCDDLEMRFFDGGGWMRESEGGLGNDDRRLIAGMKNRKVVSFGDVKQQLFGVTFFGEIGCELLPQQTRMGTNDAVFAGVVSGRATEDADADLLLGRIFGRIPNCTSSYVKQELAEAR